MNLLYLMTALLAFVASPQQNPRGVDQYSGAYVAGTILDVNNAPVAKAVLVFKREAQSQTVETRADGTYAIHLLRGVYTVSLSHSGFCTMRRAAFSVRTMNRIQLDFQLWVCPSDNFGKYRYVELDPEPEIPLKPLVLFGESSKAGDRETFTGAVLSQKYPVVVTYNQLTVKADKVVYSEEHKSIIGTGNVVVEEGADKRLGSKVEIIFHNGEPQINLTK